MCPGACPEGSASSASWPPSAGSRRGRDRGAEPTLQSLAHHARASCPGRRPLASEDPISEPPTSPTGALPQPPGSSPTPWIVLGACTIAAVATAPGQTLVVSLFYAPLREATGLSATGLASAYSLATLTSAAAMTRVGWLSDRIGPHRLMIGAACGLAVACGLAGRASGLASLVAIFLGLRFFGQGALMLASAHTTALWFERRLGTAEGLRGTVVSLSFAALPVLIDALIGAVGWRAAYATLGIVVASAVVPSALWIGTVVPPDPEPGACVTGAAPAPAPRGHTLAAALRTPAYWLLALSLVSVASAITAVLFHLSALLRAWSLPGAHQAPAMTLLLLGVAGATLVGGWLADRIDERWLISAGGLCMGGALAAAALAEGSGPLLLAAGIGCGVGQGLVSSVGGTALARWFGRAHHGAIRGFTVALSVAGTSAGPLLLSLGHDLTGGWSAGLLGFAGVLALLGVGVGWVRRPER